MGLGGVLGSSCALWFGAPLGFGAPLAPIVLFCFFLSFFVRNKQSLVF